MPPAPVRFSTTTDCLSASERCFASSRHMVSVVPPGAWFEIRRTTPVGAQSWAGDGPATLHAASAHHPGSMFLFRMTSPLYEVESLSHTKRQSKQMQRDCALTRCPCVLVVIKGYPKNPAENAKQVQEQTGLTGCRG